MKPDKLHQYLEDYLNGTLKGELLRQFENVMQSNAELGREVAAQQKLVGLLRQITPPKAPPTIRLRVMETLRTEATAASSATQQASKPPASAHRPRPRDFAGGLQAWLVGILRGGRMQWAVGAMTILAMGITVAILATKLRQDSLGSHSSMAVMTDASFTKIADASLAPMAEPVPTGNKEETEETAQVLSFGDEPALLPEPQAKPLQAPPEMGRLADLDLGAGQEARGSLQTRDLADSTVSRASRQTTDARRKEKEAASRAERGVALHSEGDDAVVPKMEESGLARTEETPKNPASSIEMAETVDASQILADSSLPTREDKIDKAEFHSLPTVAGFESTPRTKPAESRTAVDSTNERESQGWLEGAARIAEMAQEATEKDGYQRSFAPGAIRRDSLDNTIPSPSFERRDLSAEDRSLADAGNNPQSASAGIMARRTPLSITRKSFQPAPFAYRPATETISGPKQKSEATPQVDGRKVKKDVDAQPGVTITVSVRGLNPADIRTRLAKKGALISRDSTNSRIVGSIAGRDATWILQQLRELGISVESAKSETSPVSGRRISGILRQNAESKGIANLTAENPDKTDPLTFVIRIEKVMP